MNSLVTNLGNKFVVIFGHRVYVFERDIIYLRSECYACTIEPNDGSNAIPSYSCELYNNINSGKSETLFLEHQLNKMTITLLTVKKPNQMNSRIKMSNLEFHF